MNNTSEPRNQFAISLSSMLALSPLTPKSIGIILFPWVIDMQLYVKGISKTLEPGNCFAISTFNVLDLTSFKTRY
jgi:hypothetical protein